MIWDDGKRKAPVRVGPVGWVLVVLRAMAMVLVLVLGVLATALLRLIEQPVFGAARPWTPWITMAVCRSALRILGLRLEVEGQMMAGHGAVVANHCSWLDILVLNARKRVYFVAKEEVSTWPGFSVLAKITGTLFIRRDRREAARQVVQFQERLNLGHKLLFFPEGTSSDSIRVLPFKTTLFASFFTPDLKDVSIQPVSIVYVAPEGEDPRFYGWWGEMGMVESLVEILSRVRQGHVKLIYHTPLPVADFAGRKELAAAAETAVRSGLERAAIN